MHFPHQIMLSQFPPYLNPIIYIFTSDYISLQFLPVFPFTLILSIKNFSKAAISMMLSSTGLEQSMTKLKVFLAFLGPEEIFRVSCTIFFLPFPLFQYILTHPAYDVLYADNIDEIWDHLLNKHRYSKSLSSEKKRERGFLKNRREQRGDKQKERKREEKKRERENKRNKMHSLHDHPKGLYTEHFTHVIQYNNP